MEQIAELERRIAVALDRIGRGVEYLAEARNTAAGVYAGDGPSDGEAGAESGIDQAELARLVEALAAERDIERDMAEQAQDRLRKVKEREHNTRISLQAEIDRLSRALDEQGLEMQRIRNLVVQLRDQVRMQREAAEQNVADPALINRALQTELEAFRATRLAEMAEMDGILAELTPLVAAAEAAQQEGEANA